MNFAPLSKSERATWRELLTPPSAPQALACTLLCLFSLFTLSACESTPVCVIFLICAAVFYYLLTQSFFAIGILALPGLLLYSLSHFFPAVAANPFLLPAAYAAILLGGVCGAFLILHNAKHAYLLLVLPVSAALLAVFLTGAPERALLVLIPTALAIALAVSLRDCRPQTPALILCAAVLALCGIAAWLVLFYLKGWSDPNPLLAFVEEFRLGYVRMYEALLAPYAEQGILLGISAADLQNAAVLLGNLLPGLYLALCAVFAFAAWRMLLRLLRAWHSLPRIPLRVAVLTVSPLAAGLFVLAHVASILANATEPTLFGTVCLNLAILLIPALALVGFTSLLPNGKQRSCLSLLLAFGLIALLWVRPDLTFILSAYIGAFHILTSRIFHRKGEK